MNNKQKIKCLFGFHEYTIPDSRYRAILICKHCKRYGYRRNALGYDAWYEYDEEGNMIYRTGTDGYKVEYDKEGNITYSGFFL